MSLINCKNVSFSYEGRTVISNLNFEVEKGQFVCIIGENGAGKSTLIKGILQLKNPSSGSIFLGDGLKEKQIGYLSQQTIVQRDFPASVFEVVLSGRLNNQGFLPFYKKSDKDYAKKQLEFLEIGDLKNRCYRELSGGQQQRVLLARALCAGRKLLVLDEPVTGLDPVMSAEMYRLIEKLNKKEDRTIIMVSHDIKEAVVYATHILHLGKGQLFYGLKDDYIKSEVGKFFLGGRMNDT
ncbi:metal ABC transporter ATP-binding protein [Anaerosacchariphilus polymeriproducens]|uniref:Metal ABC transporter ATP-binding protein n=1 Tax=Anaerosacchariphilus polymeriproducens TaxID=1812858 RepID=A0A371AW39_9FIRM|nr:metal ABC transporter ATP-binding protein [Anaerosacchariphilus polymeriproducens]RDU23786.1 metal ABC transporter ATP-binding protein [Anaerosacchariphilus polymeriproducens]